MQRAWRSSIGLLLAGVVLGFCPQPVMAQAFSLSQVTNSVGGSNDNPSLDATGTQIAFSSNRDLIPGSPGNADGNDEIFLFDTTTGRFTQITNTTGGLNLFASISAAGTRIAFVSNRDLTPGSPGNADGNSEIFLFDTLIKRFTQITNTTGGSNGSPKISAAGTRIAFVSNRDLTPGSPGNADGNNEIFLFDTLTGHFTQITNTTGGDSPFTMSNASPSINAGGTHIAFVSNRDLTPGNPGNADGNSEIFLFDTTTGRFTQITNTTGGGIFVIEPKINASGTRIRLRVPTGTLTPGNPGNADGNFEIFLFDVVTERFTQITQSSFGSTGEVSINAAGNRIAFMSDRDLVSEGAGNADLNREIFLAEAETAVAIPTLSEWSQVAMAGLLLVGGVLTLRRRAGRLA